MRILLALSTACALIFAQTPAQASPGCNGCNLVEEGGFSARLVGQTVYYGLNPVTVAAVDTSLSRIYWRDSAGKAWWAAANTLYSPGARRERNVNYGMGALVLGALWCAAGGCKSSGEGREGAGGSYASGPSAEDAENARFNHWRQNNLDQGLNDNGTQR